MEKQTQTRKPCEAVRLQNIKSSQLLAVEPQNCGVSPSVRLAAFCRSVLHPRHTGSYVAQRAWQELVPAGVGWLGASLFLGTERVIKLLVHW